MHAAYARHLIRCIGDAVMCVLRIASKDFSSVIEIQYCGTPKSLRSVTFFNFKIPEMDNCNPAVGKALFSFWLLG